MRKLILLTTAIPRGDLHKKSVGLFYEKIGKYLRDFEIHHIINIDYPEKIKKIFSRDETRKLLDIIIPDYVKKYYILSETTNFSNAYKNVIARLYKEFILLEGDIIWWLEDDWMPVKEYNIIFLIKFLDINRSAISITSNAPLCSFRGGPIMSSIFFKEYFDIHRRININKDPEKQVRNNIHYCSVHNGDINVYLIYLIEFLNKIENIYDEYLRYYKSRLNALKFKNGGELRFYVGYMEKFGDNEIYYYEYKQKMEINNFNKLRSLCCKKRIEEIKSGSRDSSINYFNFVPNIFEDIGRKFNRENNLVKNNNTYLLN